METICAKCTEEQRVRCMCSKNGCSEFTEWRDKLIKAVIDRGKKLEV